MTNTDLQHALDAVAESLPADINDALEVLLTATGSILVASGADVPAALSRLEAIAAMSERAEGELQ